MKTVLITGATGSVCMNLTELLLKKGQRVVMYARHPLSTEDEQELRQLPGELILKRRCPGCRGAGRSSKEIRGDLYLSRSSYDAKCRH